MVRKTAVVWLLLQAPALVCAQDAAAPKKADAKTTEACLKAWEPEFEKSLALLTKQYWADKCGRGLTPKQILIEAKKSLPVTLQWKVTSLSFAAPSALEKQLKALEASVDKAMATGDIAVLYGEKGAAPSGGSSPVAPPQASAKIGSSATAPLLVSFGSGLKPKNEPPGLGKTIDRCGANYAGAPGWYSSVARRIACTPGIPYRKSLTAYLDMTGLQNYHSDVVGGLNAGLDHFNDALAKDPVFAQEVAAFYSRIGARENKYIEKFGSKKAGLDRTAGAGPNKDLPAGWAWKEALSVAKDDPNQAMRLIGFCGHDDVMRSHLERPRGDEAAGKLLTEKRRKLDEEMRGLEARFKRVSAESKRKDRECLLCLIDDPDDLRKRIDGLRLQSKGLKLSDFKADRYFDCPSGISPFYLPRSLDEKADISDALKAKIAAAQKKKPEDIPAKYYHVLGAAAAACEMIRNGAPGWLAETVEGRSAWMYRTLRMKSDAKTCAYQRKRIRDAYDMYRRELKKGEPALNEELYREQFNEEKRMDGGQVSLSRIDAFELMESWGYGGKVLGEDIPPLDFRVGWLAGKFFKRKPEGWSDERFQAAKDRMKTFFADWEWTQAEHEAGAAFAAKVCKKEP